MINVKVDKRIELMCIMLYLCDSTNVFMGENDNKDDYFNELDKTFGDFKKHYAISELTKLTEQKINPILGPFEIAVRLNEDLSVNYQNFNSDNFYEKHYFNIAKSFIDSVQDFAKDSKFDEFFNKHTNYYNDLIKSTEQMIKDYNLQNYLSNYYGKDYFEDKNINYNIMCGYFVPNMSVNHNNIINVISANVARNLKLKDVALALNSTLLHETGHSVINQLTAKYSKIEPNYFNKESTPILNTYYKNSFSIINDTILRAMQRRFERANNENAYADKKNKDANVFGFKHIGDCEKSLAYYEKNRNLYPTLESYYNELLKCFSKQSTKEKGATK